MKFTKHTCAPYRLKDREVKTVDGHLFQFDDYPGVDVFVYKYPKYGVPLYCCVEPTTGLPMASAPQSTRKAAIAHQHACFEMIRTSLNGKGKHAYVIDFVKACLESAKKQ